MKYLQTKTDNSYMLILLYGNLYSETLNITLDMRQFWQLYHKLWLLEIQLQDNHLIGSNEVFTN